ncbi:hypothetical protein [Streptomyces sp. HNM0574]|uniref:hypothetical protein n=1 Tax=Streptomyces sp. HNM0574 TaxID=2714954 RepID=UPI001469B7EF|nr:hypothetical protein [Streptomyces sp. HNM0574]NLU69063.1 hypothetical protein [Streptomyces sp. HNM0574]
MRPAYDVRSGGSGSPARAAGSDTPIYDSLYAEYSRLFRTLPGDRSDEEDLKFEGFGTVRGTGSGNWERWSGSWQPPGWGGTGWQNGGRQRDGQPPAALPPGRRDGHGYGL